MAPIRLRHLLAISMDDKSVTPRGWTQAESDAELNSLVEDGYLTHHAAFPGYALTDKGTVFIEAITKVPRPIQVWTVHWSAPKND